MTDLAHISTLSACAIGRLITSGDVDPVALTEHLYDKIDAYEDKAVFITLTKKRAMSEASASAKRHREGKSLSPLDGVPMVHKDLVDLKGEITTAASDIYRNAPPAEADAPVAANMAKAGMVCLGKVNLTEFAYSGIGLNPHFGTPKNPHNKDVAHIPGGSSSGTGVAISAGLAPCGIGTDTGGSIRIPASLNGVTGYKPTRGRIPDEGVFALSRTLDSVGPLARSVEDCVLLDMVLRGAVHTSVKRQSLDGKRIIVPETIVLDDLESAVSENFEASLSRLSAQGAVIDRMPIDLFNRLEQVTRDHGNLTASDAYVEHYDLVESPDIKRIDRRVVARIMAGKKMSAADVTILQRERARAITEFNALLGDALVAMPTTAITAPEIQPLEDNDDVFNEKNLLILRNTAIGNTLNVAGVAMPNGVNSIGMPTSFLLCCAEGRDDMLLGHSLTAEAIIGATN